MDKPTFLATLRSELTAWETLLSRARPEQWRRPADQRQPAPQPHWSLLDVVAHVSAYQLGLVEWLSAARQGVALRLPELDDPDLVARNDRIYRRNRPRSWQDILFEALDVHRSLLALAAEFSEEELLDPNLSAAYVIPRWGEPTPLWRCIANDSYEHIQQHAAEARAWLVAEE